MASGILGAAALNSGQNTQVYQVPTDTFSVVTISITNRSNSASSLVRIALTANDIASTVPDNADWIEYDTELLANGVLERNAVVLDAQKYIVVFASGTATNVVVYGIETSTI